MLRPTRPRLLALALTLALALAPAIPALAAPAADDGPAFWNRLAGWWSAAWSEIVTAGRASAGSEAYPSLDPDGDDLSLEQPAPSPDASSADAPESQGEAYPSLDPNG
jgi:hypothetical protein